MSISKILRRRELLLVGQELYFSTRELAIKSVVAKSQPETKTLVFNVCSAVNSVIVNSETDTLWSQ